MNKRNHKLLDKKVIKYLLPSVMMCMALQLGNVVDTILVGNLLGTEAMSAIQSTNPIMVLEQITSYGLGTGGSICVGILLGKRDRKAASDVFSSVFWLTLIVGIMFAVSAPFLSGPLAGILTKGGELKEAAQQYVFIWMLGAPVLGIGLYLVHFMGLESRPQISSAYIIVSNVVNLVLDYVFLAYTPLGIRGAALSTMIGYFTGLFVYIPYIFSREKMLKLVIPRSIKPLCEAIKAGTPTLISMVLTIAKGLCANYIILTFLGVSGMTVYTVCSNVLLIIMMLTQGIIAVIPNLAGVLYGEKDYYGLRSVCIKTMKITSAVTVAALIVSMVFTGNLAKMFGINDPELYRLAVPSMRCFLICLPFYVLNQYLISYYQSIEKTVLSSVITILQCGTILIPATYIGIRIAMLLSGSGFIAMGLAFPVAEGLTALAVFIILKIKYGGINFFILPGENSGDWLDLTITASITEATESIKQVQAFCSEKGIPPSLANLISVAAEEMTVNVIKHGGRSSEWIDICMQIDPEVLRFRIRDNGIPFDPTEYSPEEKDVYSTGGIEIVRKLATNIVYIRAIDMNNTVIEINRTEETVKGA